MQQKLVEFMLTTTFQQEFILKNILIQTNVINAAQKNNINKLIFLVQVAISSRRFKKNKENDILAGKLEMTNEPYAVAKYLELKCVEKVLIDNIILIIDH